MNYKKAFIQIKELLEFMITNEKLPKSPCDTPIEDEHTGTVCTWHRTDDFTKGQQSVIRIILEFIKDIK